MRTLLTCFCGYRRRLRRTEDTQARAFGNVAEEDLLLNVGDFRQHQKWFWVEWCELMRIGSLRRGGDPALIFAKKIPNRPQQRGIQGLEIEMKNNQRPVCAIVILKSFFNDRPNTLEEVRAKRGFRAGGLIGMRHHRTSFAGSQVDSPGDVLLDPDREPSLEGAIDPVSPLAFVRIAVVGIEQGPVVV